MQRPGRLTVETVAHLIEIDQEAWLHSSNIGIIK
jgi:hypothetical protein